MTLLQTLHYERERMLPRQVALKRLKHATSHIGTYSNEVAELCHALGLPTPSPKIMDPLLLAAVQGEGGSLWRLPNGEHAGTTLGKSGRNAWSLTQAVAKRFVPVLVGEIEEPQAQISELIQLWPDGKLLVDGASFGAAFLLAHASRLLQTPIATDIAATAEVQEDGSIRQVDGLKEKIQALRDWAPGVKRLLVAQEQIQEVEDLLMNTSIQAVPVSHALDVLDAGFENHAYLQCLSKRWQDNPKHAEKLTLWLFMKVVIEHRFFNNWRALINTAELIQTCPVSETTQWQAKVVANVAARHCGISAQPLPPKPAHVRIPRPYLLSLLSQEIQSATDRCAPEWKTIVQQGEAAVRGDESQEELQLLGALGRAYASWGEWDNARRTLRAAIEGWSALVKPEEASRAGCALFWVEGLEGNSASIKEVCALLSDCMESPQTGTASRAYLALALGRAWATQGQMKLALEAFDQAPQEALLDNRTVAASIARWRRRAGDKSVDMGQFKVDVEETKFAILLARADEGDQEALKHLPALDEQEWIRAGGREDVAMGLRRFPY